jgi:DNA-binding transcriptional LysR family regulator
VIELEEELGVQLLSRTTRSVKGTENGQAYYERCLAILADLEEADLAAILPPEAANPGFAPGFNVTQLKQDLEAVAH